MRKYGCSWMNDFHWQKAMTFDLAIILLNWPCYMGFLNNFLSKELDIQK